MVHFNGAGSAVWVRCGCGSMSEFKSVAFGIEARFIPKEEEKAAFPSEGPRSAPRLPGAK